MTDRRHDPAKAPGLDIWAVTQVGIEYTGVALSQPLLEPGHVVAARYRIQKAIGRGGYGTVYCATRLEDNLGVALKLMHTRHIANPDKIRRFQREAALVARLHHKNVVETLDYGHTLDGLPFIIFELLRGHSLKYRLRNEGALSFARTCQISIQILRALRVAHALDIAHRDIKPANIYLCAGREDDFVKVLDFGIAKALGDKGEYPTAQLTRAGQLLGTPAYMSPEQIKSADIGLTCDLYSLGLVMAELLSGRKLVTGANEQKIFLAHLSAGPHVLSEAVRDTPLARLIGKAIEKEPGDRFASAEEMLNAIDVVAAAERFAGGPAGRADAEPPSELSQLKETVRTSEPPPASALAGLKETVRTSEGRVGDATTLASLQETVQMNSNVSVDELLRAQGISLPKLDSGTTAIITPQQQRPAGPVVADAGGAERSTEFIQSFAPASRAHIRVATWVLPLLVVITLAAIALTIWVFRSPLLP